MAGFEDQRGVVYLSVIPKGMGVVHLRQQMQRYGDVTRLWLANATTGSGKPVPDRFEEGWVEFRDKAVAKRVAEGLNGAPVQAGRHMGFSGSLWAMKYLKGIQWHQLADDAQLQKQRRLLKFKARRKELLDANDEYYRRRVLAKAEPAQWQQWEGWDMWKEHQQKRKQKGKGNSKGKAAAQSAEGPAAPAEAPTAEPRKRKRPAEAASPAAATPVTRDASDAATPPGPPKLAKRRRLK